MMITQYESFKIQSFCDIAIGGLRIIIDVVGAQHLPQVDTPACDVTSGHSHF